MSKKIDNQNVAGNKVTKCLNKENLIEILFCFVLNNNSQYYNLIKSLVGEDRLKMFWVSYKSQQLPKLSKNLTKFLLNTKNVSHMLKHVNRL